MTNKCCPSDLSNSSPTLRVRNGEGKPSLHIEGRRWFERTNGNTYHSVRIWRDGKQITTIPFEYGYDDGYLQTAVQWLISEGLAPKDSIGCTRTVREDLGGTYSVIDVTRKKDL